MAITAPVLERLHERSVNYRITVSTGIPENVLRSRIHCPFDTVHDDLDFGLRMHRDLSVDIEATLADYAAIHSDWQDNVARRAAWLARLGCDLMLSNISYLNIAAAHRANIPTIAVSPLNWADLYRYYAPATPVRIAVQNQMTQAYNESEVFFTPEPCMPMPNFANVEIIPPVVQTGRDQQKSIRTLFNLDATMKLLLLALGGHEAELNVDDLPVIDGACWLVDEKWRLRREDVLPLNRTGLMFPDLLASCDLLVCKPGYGAFTEAARLAKPVVYIRRPDWPEETCLIEWLQRQVSCSEAPRQDARGLESSIRKLFNVNPGRPCSADGVDICAERILSLSGHGKNSLYAKSPILR
ncbi:MAG: hypothetical protein MAG794_01083 [Gammaproteobacteria bacterium]|nr:hypothetical protein [Gammaproteobacteria bacterium]